MTEFIAHNAALESASTGITAGLSYATGAKVALQLNIPSGGTILVTEFGWAQDAATATGTLLELSSTATASTVSTAHTTTTIKPIDSNNVNAGASRLTYGATTNTGFGNGAISSRTVLRKAAHLYVPQSFVLQWPLGSYPEFGTNAAEYLQLVVNTPSTVNALCWIKWIERI